MLFVRGGMCCLLEVVCLVNLFVRGDGCLLQAACVVCYRQYVLCCLLEAACVGCYRQYVLFVTGSMCGLLQAVCVVLFVRGSMCWLLQAPFDTLDPEEMNQITLKFAKNVMQLEKGLPPNGVVPILKEKVDQMRERVSHKLLLSFFFCISLGYCNWVEPRVVVVRWCVCVCVCVCVCGGGDGGGKSRWRRGGVLWDQAM